MKKWSQLESHRTQGEHSQHFFLAIDIKLVIYKILNNETVTTTA